MAIYIPHDILRALAHEYKPTLPIKDCHTWIAVLRHDKLDPEDVHEEKDFLWLKRHGRITVRTIRHYYFTRFMTEDFRLKHKHYYPKLRNTAATLREREEADGNLVVLRAFESKDAELDDEFDLAQQIRTGATAADAIQIPDDDDDEPVNAYKHEPVLHEEHTDDTPMDGETSGTDGNSSTDSSQTSLDEHGSQHHVTTREASTEVIGPSSASPKGASARVTSGGPVESPSTSRKRAYSENEDDPASQQLQRELSSARQDVPRKSPTPVYETAVSAPNENDTHFAPYGFGPIESNEDDQMNVEFSPDSVKEYQIQAKVQTLAMRISNLPPRFQSRAAASFWHLCELSHCGKRFYIKPWTQFGPNYQAMCTRDSHLMLKEDRNTAALRVMEAQILEERQAKFERMQVGETQDMDDDQPIVQRYQYESRPSFGYGPSDTVNPAELYGNSETAIHDSLVNGYNTQKIPRFGDLDHLHGASSPVFEDMDTAYADDYLNVINPDSLLVEVDAAIGNSSSMNWAEGLNFVDNHRNSSQHRSSYRGRVGTQDQIDAEDSEAEAETEQQHDAETDEDPEADPNYVDAAANQDGNSYSDYSPDDENDD